MAEAFIERGAKVYISWSLSVTASHTDLATKHLLQHLLTEKPTIKESIQKIPNEIGSDPFYRSLLLYYPYMMGELTIEDIRDKR